MEFRPVGAEFFHANRQTDERRDNSQFSQFCDRAKNAHRQWKWIVIIIIIAVVVATQSLQLTHKYQA